MKVAYVPFYSPNAVAELALAHAMALGRHTQYMGHRSHQGNLKLIASCLVKKFENRLLGLLVL